MAENKNLVEDALIQMKNLEEAVAENAKGILASTMKEEIKELVKESLSEQEDDEVETDVEMDVTGDEDGDEDADVEMDMDMDMDTEGDDETIDVDMDMDMDTDMDDETIDLTGASDEEVLKVFKAMGEDDGIIIKKDGDSIHLTDDNADVEYMVKLGESTEEMYSMDEDSDEEDESWKGEEDENVDYKKAIKDVFGSEMDEEMDMDSISEKMFDSSEDDEEVVYEIEMDEDAEEDEMYGGNKHDYKRRDGHKMGDVDGHYKDYEGEDDEEVVYEIEMDEDSDEEDESWTMDEAFTSKPVIGKGGAIGKGPGNIGWKSMKPVNKKPYNDDMKSPVTTKGKTGPASLTKKVSNPGKGSKHGLYHKPETVKNKEINKPNISDAIKAELGAFGDFGKMKGNMKKAETKEAARTLGNGSKFRKGGLPKPHAHSAFNANINEEVETLRAKNEEYRKALNIFRSKLNEVAVFNSNLAYATRLFTEHTTTKQEKINILRRFDDVQTIKESKNLYQSIKSELNGKENKVVTESIENRIDKVQSTGSSINLIESKTYENPQFLRMKDLMGKIK